MRKRTMKKKKTLHITHANLARSSSYRIWDSLLLTCSSPAIDWFGNTEPYGQTNKQTNYSACSPGQFLTSRPLGADKEPPRAGNLHLPGPGTEEVSPSWTSEPPTAHSTCRAALKASPKYDALDDALKHDNKIEGTLKATLQDHNAPEAP